MKSMSEQPDFATGDLVRHRKNQYIHDTGIVLSVKKILGGLDVEVLWPEGRIIRHHSSCLEIL